METNIDIFEKYQTLIVGLIGFVGVIITLLVNSWLDRKQHSRQVGHERNVLRTALLAELGAVSDMLSGQIETFEKAQSDGTKSVLIPITDVSFIYQNTIGRIGLLTQKEIGTVTKAYLLMRELPDRIRILQIRSESPAENKSKSIHVGSKYFKFLQELHENFLSEVKTAIKILDNKNSD